MYNFNHLYYFYVTAKSGGVSDAAKHLRISQPSLSSQLKVLEGTLEIKLFEKVGRRNKLTQAGSIIFGFCRRMFEVSEEMEEVLLERISSAGRRISIGVSDEVERSFVVEMVSLFLQKHGLDQRPKVTMISGPHEYLVERLRFRELDAVVTQMSMTDPDLTNLQRAQVPVSLMCSNTWKGNSRVKKLNSTSEIKEFVGGESAQWVMPSAKFKLRAEIDRFFERNQLKGHIVFESDVMASLVRSVTDGIGMTLLPVLYVAKEIREKSVRTLGPKKGLWKYRVWLSCHNQNREDPLIRSLARSFKQICEQSNSL